MFDKRMEDSGIPPWCVGLNYRRSDPPRHDSFEDESRTDKLGAFKYVCVGYAESKYPFYSRNADEGGGEGGAKGGAEQAPVLRGGPDARHRPRRERAYPGRERGRGHERCVHER